MNDITFLNERIDLLNKRKAKWLQLKKDKRGNNVNELNQTIARLKRWKIELSHKKKPKSIKKPSLAINKLTKGFKGLQDASDHCVDAMSMFGSLTSVFQAVRERDQKKRPIID